jgi:pimeloyl-[acyl-carrier protein] methyl ester esterase
MSTQLNIQVIGKGNPLIMLHGWGWNSSIWTPLITHLVDNFQLFLIDVPGFGKSPLLTDDYKIADVVESLLAVTPDNAAWLGWSLGGMIAWYIAIHHPERVSKLVTVAASPKFVRADNWPGVSLATLHNFSALLVENHQKTLLEFLELQLRGAPKNIQLFSELEKQISQTNSLSIPALLGGLRLLQELDLRADIATLFCPSLHLFGSNDTLVPQSIVKLLQVDRCKILNRSGHMPFFSQPDEFLKHLRDFLRDARL